MQMLNSGWMEIKDMNDDERFVQTGAIAFIMFIAGLFVGKCFLGVC